MLVRLTASQSVAEPLVKKLVPNLIRNGLARDVWVHSGDVTHIRMEEHDAIVSYDKQVVVDCSVSDPSDAQGIRRAIERATWPLNPISVRVSVINGL